MDEADATGRRRRSPAEGHGTPPLDQDSNRKLFSPRLARVVRWGLVAWSLIGVLILGYLLYRYALRPVRIIVAPLLVAMVIVYLLNPIVSRLSARGIPRAVATILTYLVFLGIVGVALRFLIPAVADQVSTFAKTVPDLLGKAQVSAARRAWKASRAASS